MKIMAGDRFVRDTKYGRISYTIVDIEYEWGMYGTLLETIVYKGERGNVWRKSRQRFESLVSEYNTRRIPREEIINVYNYVPKHRMK